MTTGNEPKPETTAEKTTRPATARKPAEATEPKTTPSESSALAVPQTATPAPAEPKGALQVSSTMKHFGDRPIVHGGFHSSQSFMMAGERPIMASTLVVQDTFKSNGADRPITAATVEVTGSFFASGERPIMADHLEIVGNFFSSGERPVTAGNLVISDSYSVMGNRPVASNVIDDAPTLMGFID